MSSAKKTKEVKIPQEQKTPIQKSEPNKGAAKSNRIVQSDFPRHSLAKARQVADILWQQLAGQPSTPPDVAFALGMSPTSSSWRTLCGASEGYGITIGGAYAQLITLSELGRKLVAPTEDGEDKVAQLEAVLSPRIIREFFERYHRAKFPNDVVAKNVLTGTLGLPSDRTDDALEILKENGKLVGLIRETPNGLFVSLDSNATSNSNGKPNQPDLLISPVANVNAESSHIAHPTVPASFDNEVDNTPAPAISLAPKIDAANNRVFITHGKQRGLLGQLKELLVFGQMEPVVSVERETTAIGVPEKVFDDMRSCSAGVIHVTSEGELLDTEGNKHIKINENVLIEIGEQWHFMESV